MFSRRSNLVTYCGGGIAATVDAFALLLLGRNSVSVYDASLTEWGNDPSLSMETG
jgi:thiosulfate/3-mercaptopyruvate sulfurtransferase